ncbi:hypothetical protein ACHAXT_006340 [Thalassiosira profunda]
MLPLRRLTSAAALLLRGNTAEAWAVPRQFAIGSGRQSQPPSSDAVADALLGQSAPTRLPSTVLPVHTKRRSILSLMMSSTAGHTVDSSAPIEVKDVDEATGTPVLRTLYDAPPQLDSESDNSTDNNNTNGNSTAIANGNDGWVTEVASGMLPTEEGSSHVLYFEVHRRIRSNQSVDESSHSQSNTESNSKRLTALFLHGGPGAGCFPNHVRFFSPELYETVVLLDQRGCGRSTPRGETQNNTLELLVGDVERLRVHLFQEEGYNAAVRPWDVILGGSWGCTLALAYAHSYPEHVRAMVLRGVCLFRSEEIDWLFGDPPLAERGSSGGSVRTSNLRSLLVGGGDTRSMQSYQSDSELTTETTTLAKKTASTLFPDAWREFGKGGNIAKSPASTEQGTNERRSTLQKYYNMILGSDPSLRLRAVKAWMRWEMGIYSSGFRGAKGGSKGNNTLLVWSPAMQAWAQEDARVSGNRSVASTEVASCEVREEAAQSLRRFSSPALQPEMQGPREIGVAEPMPVQSVNALSDEPIPTQQPSKGNGTNSTFDPTTFVPAQAMLTCFYSANDDYCIGPYRPFLSLAPPPGVDLSSWYSSRLPPTPPHLAYSTPAQESSTTEHPLPPTIAIQGGNDAVCPPDTALDLHGVWTELELRIALEGGHSMYDPVIAGEIVKATDRFGRELMEEE